MAGNGVESIIRVELSESSAMKQGKPPTGGEPSDTSGGGGGGKGGWAAKLAEKMGVDSKKLGDFNKKFLRGQLGLNFSVGAIMKQSQIFTSTIGVIFQLLGALVDVMLAPLIPLLIPAIQAISNFIPVVAKWSEKVLGPMVAAIMSFFKTIGTGVWDGIKLVVTAVESIDKFIADVFDASGSRVIGWVTSGTLSALKGPGWLSGLVKALGMAAWNIIKFSFTTLPRILWTMASGAIKLGMPMIGRFFVFIIEKIGGFFKWILDGVKGGLSTVFNWIFGKIVGLLGKIKFMGIGDKITKAAASLTAKGGMGGLIKMMAKSTKAIPVLGAVATAGFGIAETVDAYKKGGMDAMIATAVKTAAATALTATGNSVAGLAVDMAGTALINRTMMENNKRTTGGSGWAEQVANTPTVAVTLINQNRDGTEQERHELTATKGREQRRDLAQEMGGY